MGFLFTIILSITLPNFKVAQTVEIPHAKKISFLDLNEDDKRDILVSTNSGLILYENDGFYIEIPISTSPHITDFTSADLNGDGRKDLIILDGGKELKIYKNTELAGFPLAFSHSFVSSGFTSISIIDFNRDGILDIYLSNPINGDVVFLGEGRFEFVPVALQSMSRIFIPVKIQFNLLWYILASDNLLKWLEKEKGIPPRVFVVKPQKTEKIKVADINNDGEFEVIYLDPTGTLSVLNDTVIANHVIDFAIADFDMDTREDIAVLLNDHSFSILRNLGNGKFESNTFLSLSEEIEGAIRIFATDFNSDEIPDIAFYDGERLVLAKNELHDAHFVALKIYPIAITWLSVIKAYSTSGLKAKVFKGQKVVFSYSSKIDSIEIYGPDSGTIVLYNIEADTTYKISLSRLVTETDNFDSNHLKLYPNPTSSLTSLEYSLQTPGFVKIELINSGGQTLYLIDSGYKGSGTHRLLFNTEDLNPGTYFIRAILGEKVYQKKLIVLR